jgi:hypothetical protein
MTIPIQNYVNNLDTGRPSHRKMLLAAFEKIEKHEPMAFQEGGDLRAIWKEEVPAPTQPKPSVEVYRTAVKAINLSQPDVVTCQSACLGMAIGNKDILGIRKALLRIGEAGSPAVMSRYVDQVRPAVRYAYSGNASLEDIYGWLEKGEFLIVHTYLTGSGHVICFDGLRKNADGSMDIDVRDPYAEFKADKWAYSGPENFYTGYYSDRLMYAAAVAGQSSSDARAIYQRREINTKLKNAWVHRFLP